MFQKDIKKLSEMAATCPSAVYTPSVTFILPVTCTQVCKISSGKPALYLSLGNSM